MPKVDLATKNIESGNKNQEKWQPNQEKWQHKPYGKSTKSRDNVNQIRTTNDLLVERQMGEYPHNQRDSP